MKLELDGWQTSARNVNWSHFFTEIQHNGCKIFQQVSNQMTRTQKQEIWAFCVGTTLCWDSHIHVSFKKLWQNMTHIVAACREDVSHLIMKWFFCGSTSRFELFFFVCIPGYKYLPSLKGKGEWQDIKRLECLHKGLPSMIKNDYISTLKWL